MPEISLKQPVAKRAVIISDACIGHGSPQVISLAAYLKHYVAEQITIIEPHIADLPPRHSMYPNFGFMRIRSKCHPYFGGRSDYCKSAADILHTVKPNILVVVCTFCMPVLLFLKYRPGLIVFYSIESILQYGKADVALNRYLRDKIDLILWPEENRMVRDSARCGFENIPSLLVLNVSNPSSSVDGMVPIRSRMPRIINQGTIGVKETFANYFLDPKFLALPIDIYGPLVDETSRGLQRYHCSRADVPAAVRTVYHGCVDLSTLQVARRRRAYLVCIWSPAEERGLFAPSNKFFQAIADGVPPITTPHPQHKRIVEQYRCGIVLSDWTAHTLYRALRESLSSFATPYYRRLVENCRAAVAAELNEEVQFGRAALKIRSAFECSLSAQ